MKCKSKRRGFKIHCTVKFLKQRPCLREVSPEGCECWTPSLDSPSRLGGRSQPCALTTVPSVFSFFALGELSNLDPRPFRFRFSLTTPTAGDFMGWGGRVRVHRLCMRPTRLQANQIAGVDTWQPIIGGSPPTQAPLLRLNPGTA